MVLKWYSYINVAVYWAYLDEKVYALKNATRGCPVVGVGRFAPVFLVGISEDAAGRVGFEGVTVLLVLLL